MTTFVMYAAAIISVAIVIFMLIKKMDIKITLFLMGIVLMFVGCALGNPLGGEDFVSTGSVFLDPLKVIADQFKSTISSSGFIILILGGYSAYMSAINANSVTVNVLTKPIAKIKSVYILVPIVFLLGNLLSLVIPSASNLAVILLATLYPILIKAGMSSLTAAGIIATTATIVPTPLGSDNVAIAAELANTTEFAGLTATDYVFKYHAIVSIPTLLIMAAIHFFWQKKCDKKAGVIEAKAVESKDVEEIKGGALYKTVYAILPLLPIILLIGSFAVQKITGAQIDISVEVATLFSFIVAIICEIIRKRNAGETLKETEAFFNSCSPCCRNSICYRIKINRTYHSITECHDRSFRRRTWICTSTHTGCAYSTYRTFKWKWYSIILRNGSAYGAACGSSRNFSACGIYSNGTCRKPSPCGFTGIGGSNDCGRKCKTRAA